MDYDQVIELDNVRVEDCIDLLEKFDKRTIINDGRIIGWIEE